ncbi:hypothetical protein [Desulfonatronum lacustre]|uniref:hypothetical protein n=1 Tax=Desulfonatronum lacustre TaxID=66849 RepID=UPI00048FE55A|nr:hypothetical protein [Desulfonatronum lacustre]
MSRKFHVTSIDIFDTLMAKGRKIGAHGLIDMAKQKYILVSQNEERQKLANYVSQLPFDHDDIVNLYEIIEQDYRREKITTKQIKKALTYDQIHNSVEALSTQLANIGEKINILTNPNSPTLIIEYEYKDIDYGKATMLQEVIRKDRIEFTHNIIETNIRTAANEKCKELIQKIIQEIERAENENLDVDEIELANVADGKKRNDFFFALINSIADLQLDDVSGVKISRFGGAPIDEEHESDNGEEVLPTPELAGFIREVAIKGKALLSQKEYIDFVDKGFFISNLTWKSLDIACVPNQLVEFEAGFSDPQDCKGFQYAVKGAYTFKKENSTFSTTRKKLSEPEKISYKSKLEEAARFSKQEVTNDKS